MKTATEGVCDTFWEIFTLFGKCHNTYNAMVVDDPLIDQLGKVDYAHTQLKTYRNISLSEEDIEKFLCAYRAKFSHATVTPKMHLLEDHMIPWLKK